MSNTIYLSVGALIFTCLIAIIFFTKKKLNTTENKIYKVLIFITLISLIIELLIPFFTLKGLEEIRDLIMKLYLICCISWVSVFLMYTYFISNKDSQNRNNKKRVLPFYGYIIFNIIIMILIMFLPIYFFNENNAKYSYGPSVNLVFGVCGFYMLLMIVCIFMNFKKVKSKGYIPVITFVLLLMLCSLIQKINPELLLINFVFAFITSLMYHTIENPDLKLIQELLRNRELVQNSIEDQSKFLFKMSQDLRLPVKSILDYTNMYESSSVKASKDEAVYNIEKNAKDISYMINDVLDISKMDLKNIKIYNSNYSTFKFFEDIRKKSENLLENENVIFNMNVANNIPSTLYGDSIKLKQALMALVSNAVKYTDNGSIEIDVNALVRYDVCRLIIDVTDTGRGMNLDIINDILGQTGELSKLEEESLNGLDANLKTVKKILKLIGGSMNIKSEEGKGTTISLYIDQKYDNKEEAYYSNNVKKYNEEMDKRNRVLVVDDDLEEQNALKIAFNRNKIVCNSSLFGNDAINKINTGEKYNLIIIKDQMKSEEALQILKKLMKIKKFNVPVIVLLNKGKAPIIKHYLEDGFSDYIIKENLKTEIKRIIEKYL